MDRFLVQKTILSYFTGDPEPQTIRSAAPVTPAVPEPPHEIYSIFCDGACTKNGRRGAKAGYGACVWRGATELAVLSQAVAPSEPQTNQRAELRGLCTAVKYAENLVGAIRAGASVTIYCDSEYAINCISKWAPVWKRAGWMKADKTPVLHRDIIEPLYDSWRNLGAPVRLLHVSAHTGRGDLLSRGNARADELATAAIA